MPMRPFAAQEDWARVPGPAPGGGGPPLAPPSDEGEAWKQLIGLQQQAFQVLQAILQELQEQVQQGIVTTVTQPVPGTRVPLEVPFNPPLFTIGLTNDGAGAIEYRIPNRGNAFWVVLLPTEVHQFTFIKGVIASVGMRSAGAVAASVRIVGAY